MSELHKVRFSNNLCFFNLYASSVCFWFLIGAMLPDSERMNKQDIYLNATTNG